MPISAFDNRDGYLWQVRTASKARPGEDRIVNFKTERAAIDYAEALKGEGRKVVGLLTIFDADAQAAGYPEYSFSAMYSFFDTPEEQAEWLASEEAAAVMGGLF